MSYQYSTKPIYSAYLFLCLVNGKMYIGKTGNKKGYREHGKGNYLLDKAIRKYDRENFIVIPFLHSGLTEKQAFELEIREIAYLKTQTPYGYNITPGGDGVDSETARRGWKRTHKLHPNQLSEMGKIGMKRVWKLHPDLNHKKNGDRPEIAKAGTEGIKRVAKAMAERRRTDPKFRNAISKMAEEIRSIIPTFWGGAALAISQVAVKRGMTLKEYSTQRLKRVSEQLISGTTKTNTHIKALKSIQKTMRIILEGIENQQQELKFIPEVNSVEFQYQSL